MNFYFNSSIGTIPILPLIVFSTSPLHKACLNSILGYAFNDFHPYPCHIYILPWSLYYTCPLKPSLFHLNFKFLFYPFPLVIPSSSSHARFQLHPLLWFCLLLPLAFPSLDHTLVITLCLSSKSPISYPNLRAVFFLSHPWQCPLLHRV
jgi:hypothetical protein